MPFRSLQFFLFTIVLLFFVSNAQSQTVDMAGPAGSGSYGTNVTVLTNGNYVVTDPDYSDGGINNIGAVYLYSGSSNTLISTLKGSTANDRVGLNILALSTGNFVVSSPYWSNGATSGAGAVTWCNGITGLNGSVSSANSLVGTTTNDNTGLVYSLTNGNYVVSSPNWTNGSVPNAGAATWCNGATGLTGSINSANSLVGTTSGDRVGSVKPLLNGNYVVSSFLWHNSASSSVGSITWCNGTTGMTGAVSAANSFVGTSQFVLSANITALTNGNYVIAAGSSITWGNGSTPLTGTVNSTNSWTSTSGNEVTDAINLPNGNYLVLGFINGANSVTWANGSTGAIVPRTTSNSFVFGTINGLSVTPMVN